MSDEWRQKLVAFIDMRTDLMKIAHTIGGQFVGAQEGGWINLDKARTESPDREEEKEYELNAFVRIGALASIVALEHSEKNAKTKHGIMIEGVKGELIEWLKNTYSIDDDKATAVLRDTEFRLKKLVKTQEKKIWGVG